MKRIAPLILILAMLCLVAAPAAATSMLSVGGDGYWNAAWITGP